MPLVDYAQKLGETLYIGAGARKISSTARALAAAGVRTVIVGCPTVAGGKNAAYPRMILRGQRFSSVFFPAFRSPVLNRTLAIWHFAHFAFYPRRADRVVLYGTYFEYILCAAILRLRGVRCILDVEDGPRMQSRNPREILLRIAHFALADLCVPQQITVAHSLASRLRAKDYFVNYGVIAHAQPQGSVRRWPADGPLHVLFGGSIAPEWGLDLFCDAVRLLASQPLPAGTAPPMFHVTGHGARRALEQLAREVRPQVQIDVAQNLEVAEYRVLLSKCHIGLDLRVPHSEGAQMTFPSKVLEIAGSGMVLVSTGTSDVPLIFHPGSAIILEEATGRQLASVLAELCSSPEKTARIAQAGQQAVSGFSESSVGAALTAFLFGHADGAAAASASP